MRGNKIQMYIPPIHIWFQMKETSYETDVHKHKDDNVFKTVCLERDKNSEVDRSSSWLKEQTLRFITDLYSLFHLFSLFWQYKNMCGKFETCKCVTRKYGLNYRQRWWILEVRRWTGNTLEVNRRNLGQEKWEAKRRKGSQRIMSAQIQGNIQMSYYLKLSSCVRSFVCELSHEDLDGYWCSCRINCTINVDMKKKSTGH